MPSYLIYAPARFPEVFNAVKGLGEVAAEMPNLIAVKTKIDIDELAAIVLSNTHGEDCLIVETSFAQYKAKGGLANLGALINKIGEPK